MIGTSATMWAVYERKFQMPLFWLIFLSFWIIISSPAEFKMFFRRLAQIGSLLLIVSLIQIIFRRQGTVLFSIDGFPLVFSEGLQEAILLWIRFMILFMLAFIFSQVSLFEFLLFLNKIGISLQLSLLLLTTLKFIPFMFDEAKRGIWTIRFRGVDFGILGIRGKYIVLKKLLIPILFRGVHYVSFSALALELRGYGVTGRVKIPHAYPLRAIDYAVLVCILVINLFGIFVVGK
jgi:energy-coupling factor transporter transmembrane protein EcfT